LDEFRWLAKRPEDVRLAGRVGIGAKECGEPSMETARLR
jgi:hypothetical protein